MNVKVYNVESVPPIIEQTCLVKREKEFYFCVFVGNKDHFMMLDPLNTGVVFQGQEYILYPIREVK